jgi:hypothetical protein
MRWRLREARALWNRALASALVLDDPGVMFDLVQRLVQSGFPAYWPEQIALANEISDRPRDGVSPRLLGNVLLFCAVIQLAEGQPDRFERTLLKSTRIHRLGYPAGAYVLQPL